MPITLATWAALAGAFAAGPAQASEAGGIDRQAAPAFLAAPVPPIAPAADPPTVRWSPRVRGQDLPPAPAPSLPAAQVLPFLRGVQLVEPAALARAARIVGGRAGRALIAPGDPVFARGPAGAALTRASLPPGARLAVLRPARVLRHPHTGEVLGQETRQVALARLAADEDDAPGGRLAAILEVSEAREELLAGDLLLPEAASAPQAYAPHAPDIPLRGWVVAVERHGGVMAGTRDAVVISLGRRDGLEAGHLLEAQRPRPAAPGRSPDAVASPWSLPPERTGLLMVVHVHERLAQALVLQASDAIRPGDALGSADPGVQGQP